MPNRRVLSTVAASLLAVGLASVPAAPASASSGTCSANACEWVQNNGTGTSYIHYVNVYNPNSGATRTIRLLYNGSVVATWTGPTYPGVQFTIEATLRSGTCIQGGIVDVPDARTPCWYVP
jgi:hypothetical protein